MINFEDPQNKENLTYLFEEQWEGDYKKFNNNQFLFVKSFDDDDNILNEFSYWTYEHTKQNLIITDLQGVKIKENSQVKYILTDPVINSVDGRFGKTDLGKEGIVSCVFSFKYSKQNAEEKRIISLF